MGSQKETLKLRFAPGFRLLRFHCVADYCPNGTNVVIRPGAEKKTKLTSDTTGTMQSASHNQILSKVNALNNNTAYYLYNIPAAKSGTVNVSAYLDADKIHQRIQYRFDRYSGNLLLKGKNFEALPLSEQIKSLNSDLHTGTIIGIWGKILVFIAGLIAASLPVTGFLMWLWRKKSK